VILSLSHKELQNCDPDTSVRPVCKQYEFMGMATPGSVAFQNSAPKVDPHLRSAKAVLGYTISVAGEDVGIVRDLVLDQTDWSVRYLQIEQQMNNRIILFHVVPNAVKRISWVANRVFLRELSPVQLQDSEVLEPIVLPNENAALASAAA
jgi:sporulation protein YlmC with PRC-barrel domain